MTEKHVHDTTKSTCPICAMISLTERLEGSAVRLPASICALMECLQTDGGVVRGWNS